MAGSPGGLRARKWLAVGGVEGSGAPPSGSSCKS